ncbi:hypothetical protein GALL_473630 [mine drainage metagenome]|uniref:Uncharacterized protein n=1 Tax=mine drainage metagenome TaxID=410659 RepID=A0A1J5PHT6_9ZZZZ
MIHPYEGRIIVGIEKPFPPLVLLLQDCKKQRYVAHLAR